MELWERTELRGTTLGGQYRIGSCIGVGGTAVVFEAKRVFDESRVIVKTLRPTFVHETDIVNRLCREAEVTASLRHPGIVPVVDQGLLPDGSPYLVMKRVDGESLASLIHRCGSLNVAETSVIAIRVASILHAIHAQGVVHRDLKPEHVILDRGVAGDLKVFLLDFGVCASSKASPEEQESEKGRVFGTPSYVSPEQAIGNPHVDGRADLFALGVIMHEALTGSALFTAPNVATLLRKIIREDAPTVRSVARHVSPEIDMVLSRLLARNREDRFPSAQSLMRALLPLVSKRLDTEQRLASILRVGNESPTSVETARSVAA